MVQLKSQATAKHAKMGARQIYEALKDQILSHVDQSLRAMGLADVG
ncbi:hypothetical protein [Rhizobium ruizarguesonis]|nr:hypothetical protein [Rhizobium ruizarguesonis]